MGELYAALIYNGQMATKVNQKGYDVISKDGEKISVKTTAKQNLDGIVNFNPNTLDLCDRILILFFNKEEMQIEVLFDGTVREAKRRMVDSNGKKVIAMSKLRSTRKKVSIEKQLVVRSAVYREYKISELESGTILLTKNWKPVKVVKPEPRKICDQLNLSLLNANGNPHNTRQLGNLILKRLKQSSAK
jgi:hypothetical protein